MGSSQRAGIISGDTMFARKSSADDVSQSNGQQLDYSKSFKDITSLYSSLTEESSPNAASEKDLGNEYFKKKKFKEAIDCYSRSIALSPTAVAFANRAMAYLKLKRFEEAEADCTEALNLDDRYTKAYSRRATARKELGKLKASIEDSEFALRIEPQNQELKKQHAEAKAIYAKEILDKSSRVMRSSTRGEERAGANGDFIKVDKPLIIVKEVESTEMTNMREESKGSREGATLSSTAAVSKNHGVNKREPAISVQELASRAASRALAEAEKNIAPPNSAYQFEITWKRLSGDCRLQARLLKAISPSTLPQLFKSSLTATLLIDIIKCISTFFKEETELAIKFLESLTKVSRFDMIIMSLFAEDKSDLGKMWAEVFLNSAVPIEYVETLNQLHHKYCLR